MTNSIKVTTISKFADSTNKRPPPTDALPFKLVTVMTVQQASEHLGLAVSTLNKWRCHGGGPAFIKMGRAVRYRIEDLEGFMQRSRTFMTSD